MLLNFYADKLQINIALEMVAWSLMAHSEHKLSHIMSDCTREPEQGGMTCMKNYCQNKLKVCSLSDSISHAYQHLSCVHNK